MDRKGPFLLGTPSVLPDSTTGSTDPIDGATSATGTDSTTAMDSTTGTDSTGARARDRRTRLAARMRRRRGVALRAGAGAAVLLGLTAGIDALDGTIADAPSAAAADALPPSTTPAPALQAPVNEVAGVPATIDALKPAHTKAVDHAVKAAAEHAAHVAKAEREAREARLARAKQAARAAAAKRAAAAAKAARQRTAAASRASSRDPRSAARAMLAARGWSGQFGCLDSLWQKESGWNYRASNPSSGAYGIPQALPGGKMASAGSDWRTNPITQISWGLSYIKATYGTPCGAWSHSQATGWY